MISLNRPPFAVGFFMRHPAKITKAHDFTRGTFASAFQNG
ncbi:Uncharacterized protein EbC_33240 [Erwinia billingiae Eb661]|uniref:Uncharacterized protein n=1 Tax=Erwinia billingiae (strain Eb661) TaxID=634500 RepID=D8MVJ8_ERWBE|nr:Uncharacterized protein EbC_33240 [Erwinia billingiae Eb661]